MDKVKSLISKKPEETPDLNKPEDIRKIIQKVEPADSVDIDEIHSKLNEIAEEKAGTPCDDCAEDEEDDNEDEDEDVDNDDDDNIKNNSVVTNKSSKVKDKVVDKNVTDSTVGEANEVKDKTARRAQNAKDAILKMDTKKVLPKEKEVKSPIEKSFGMVSSTSDEYEEADSDFFSNLLKKTESQQSNPYIKNDNFTAFID